jgi:hypothetical protein
LSRQHFQHGWLFNLRSNFNSRNGWILLFAAKRITAMDFVCSCGVLWRIFTKIFRVAAAEAKRAEKQNAPK